MSIQVIDPLADRRWDDLVARHPRASIFHQRGWLEALARTYRYRPFALTTAPAGCPLTDAVVVCHVSSWITGKRAVSLPFADHCAPLLNNVAEISAFTDWLRAECHRQQWKYVELRPLPGYEDADGHLPLGQSYYLHVLDLRRPLEQIFRALHKDSVQRRIRRAEKEQLCYEAGRSNRMLEEFYCLLLATRKRHRLPPQPRAWFRNLLQCMGDALQIRVSRKNAVPIAALLTLRHRSSLVYKYGGSDERFHHLGGVPFLFWKLIEESKVSGVEEIDLGRSDLDHEGLNTFKDRLGAKKMLLSYFRYPQPGKTRTGLSCSSQAIRQIFSILPDAVLPTVGRVLYRHIG